MIASVQTEIKPEAMQTACVRCGAGLDAEDNFCRRCGAPTARLGVAMHAHGGSDLPAGRPSWWESPWFIVPVMFLALGPLALPMLWKSRRFTRTWKIALTVLVGLYTVLLGWQCWISVRLIMTHFEALDQLKF